MDSLEVCNSCGFLQDGELDEVNNLMKRVIPHLNPFAAVSDEILLSIFSYLSVKEVVTASIVSKHWYRISQDNHLW